MNAFDTSGPAVTGPTKAEQASTRKGLERSAQVVHMSVPRMSTFSTPIMSQAAQDRSNSIKGRT